MSRGVKKGQDAFCNCMMGNENIQNENIQKMDWNQLSCCLTWSWLPLFSTSCAYLPHLVPPVFTLCLLVSLSLT